MSARAELEARARAGFRAVMLSNHTAEKFASESSARELRFLCSVFDEECSWREKSKRERLLKRARFPVPKTFDGYDWSRIRLPEGMPRNDVESCAFVGSMQNLVLYGGVGNGKTHMAIACGTTACRMGLSVMFATISDLVVRMRKAEEAGSLDRVFREVERADLVILDELGYLYRDDEGVLWFKSTAFGDDKDRVLIKHDGAYTYFASDVAYTLDKFLRDDYVIEIWGADHHGYVKRVQSVAEAFGYPDKYEVVLGQLVNLLRGGKPVRMSKRKGTMVTFEELIDEVGADATRYTLISRSSNQTIDFDIDAVKQQNNSNPVYYVQYAHARICSILRRAAGVTEEEAQKLGMNEVSRRAIGEDYDLSMLTDPTEAALARKVSEFPALIAGCARDRAPFRITHFCEELAGDYHGFYANCQVLPSEGHPVDEALSKARLAACDAVRINLEVALRLIGVTAPEVM